MYSCVCDIAQRATLTAAIMDWQPISSRVYFQFVSVETLNLYQNPLSEPRVCISHNSWVYNNNNNNCIKYNSWVYVFQELQDAWKRPCC